MKRIKFETLGLSFLALTMATTVVACSDEPADDGMSETGETGETGDGDGDEETGDGDGDEETGDGDGDSETGDGDGDEETGDGDGDSETGDGDGIDWEIAREQAGGQPQDVIFHGTRAYAAIGPKVEIFDLSDSATPVRIGALGPFQGMVTAVEVTDTLAYVAERQDLDGRLHLIDISDPSAPQELALLTYTNSDYRRPEALKLDGDILYVADSEVGLFALDVTDPQDPQVIYELPEPGMAEVEVVDSRLYFAIDGWVGSAIGALDIDANYSFLGFAGVPESLDFEFTSGHLLVGTGAYGSYVLDVSDVASPVELYADPTGARTVETIGDFAWIPAVNGMHVLDLSSPQAITHQGPTPMPTGRASAMTPTADGAFLLTELGRALSVQSIDGAPTLVAQLELDGCVDCKAIVAMGDQLVAADFYTGARILDPAEMTASGRIQIEGDLVGVEGVAVEGELVYLADWASGLYIYDLSVPSEPVELAHLSTAGYPSSIAVQDGWVFIGESTNGGSVRIIDASDPAHPVEVSSIATSKTMNLEIVEDLVYVADSTLYEAGGLRIIDVSDHAAPALVGYYDLCTHVLDVAVQGDLAALACTNGLHLVNVSDPSSPMQVSVYDDPGAPGMAAVTLEGARAYVGHGYGVDIVDFSDPANPQLSERRTTAFAVKSIAKTAPSRIAISTSMGGLYHWDID